MSTFSICGPWTLAAASQVCVVAQKVLFGRPSEPFLGLATPDNTLPHPPLVPPCLPHFQLTPKSPTLSPPTAPSKLFRRRPDPKSSSLQTRLKKNTSSKSSFQVSRPAQSLAYRMRGKLESVNKKMHMIRLGANVAQMILMLISSCDVHIFCSVEKF